MTDTTKRYRLLKDIQSVDLTAKAGDIGTSNPPELYHGDVCKVWFDNNRYYFYLNKIKENLGTWFEEVVSERIEAFMPDYIYGQKDSEIIGVGFNFKNNYILPKDKFPAIKQAIESVLNNDTVEFVRESKIMEEKGVVCPLQPTNDNAFVLKDFIEKFVGKNTLIRLWHKCEGGHKPIIGDDCKMEWELSKGEYANCKVLYVKDIITVGSPNMEAVNIVIEKQSKQSAPLPDNKMDKPVLFTTEDGVGIKEGDAYYRVNTEQPYNTYTPIYTSDKVPPLEHQKNFHKRVAAEQYILENKPCLSLNDLLEVWDNGTAFELGVESYKSSQLYKNFKQLAKQKLKQQ